MQAQRVPWNHVAMFCCKLGFFGCLCPTFARAELETLTRDLDSEDCDCARVEAAYARVRSLSRSLRVSVCVSLRLISSFPLPFLHSGLRQVQEINTQHYCLKFKDERRRNVSNQRLNQLGNCPCLDTCGAYFTFSLSKSASRVIL